MADELVREALGVVRANVATEAEAELHHVRVGGRHSVVVVIYGATRPR